MAFNTCEKLNMHMKTTDIRTHDCMQTFSAKLFSLLIHHTLVPPNFLCLQYFYCIGTYVAKCYSLACIKTVANGKNMLHTYSVHVYKHTYIHIL